MADNLDFFDITQFAEAEDRRLDRPSGGQSVARPQGAETPANPGGSADISKTVAAPATFDECREGIARLSALPCPRYRAPEWWGQLVADAQRFERLWLEAAIENGWSTVQMFGCNREPWAGRLDLDGLVISLAGRAIDKITPTYATILQRKGAPTRFQLHDPAISVPFDFSASVPLWEAFAT